MNKHFLTLTALALVISAVPVIAAPPDAGQLLREQEPQRTLPQQLPKIEQPAVSTQLPETGVQVKVNSIRFSGYEGLITESELQAVVASAIGKTLSFTELQLLADRVTTYLKEKGWFLARAYLPQQDVTAGDLRIAIVNGTLDQQPRLQIKQPARIKAQVLRDLIEKQITPGQPLHTSDIERAVLLMNDLAGVTAKATLEPGTRSGTSNLVVDVAEGAPVSGSVWSDNQGNRYTGEWRGNGMLTLNNLSGYGDQLSLLMTGAAGLYQGRAGYSIPLGSRGIKANLAYTGMGYELGGPLASLNGNGTAHTIDTGLSYPIIRSRTLNLSSSIGFSYKLLSDAMSGTTIRDKNLQIGSLGLNGDLYDRYGGGGYSNWQLGAVIGNLDLSGAAADYQADQLTARANGSYAKITYAVSRLQRLNDSLSLLASYSGQYALDNLDSSEKFNLGGPNGVRAYPVGEGSGDIGGIITAELRYLLPLPPRLGSCQLIGFYDAGHLSIHETTWNNSVATISGSNSYWLQGGGIGLTFSTASLFNLRATWAHAIGDNPGKGLSGKDADGRSEQNRFWLQGMIYF